MIVDFGNALAEDLFNGVKTRYTRWFPSELHRIAQRKMLFLDAALALEDLKVPPGNRLELLKGNLRHYHSIRINDQWRIIFRWENGHAGEVKVLDYH